MTKLDGYENHLLYIKLLGLIGRKQVGRLEIAEELEIPYANTMNLVTILMKHNIIKIVSYKLEGSNKRHMYGMIKR